MTAFLKRLPLFSQLSLFVFPALAASGSFQTYPAPEGIEASPHFRVEISQGELARSSFVYITKSRQPRTNISKDASWTSFAFDGRVTIKVTNLLGDFARARVLPSSRAVATHIDGRSVSFELDRPGQFAVEFDENTDHPLFIFADAPETGIPDKNSPDVIWFGPGVHNLGEKFIEPRSGQTIYLAPGAFVKGRIKADHVSDVRITGRGVLCGTDYAPNPPNTYTVPHMMYFGHDSKRITVEGITFSDSPHYNLAVYGDDSVVRNVKTIGWVYGTDGVGIGERGLVEDCFFRGNDDAIKAYNTGLVVRRCTIWQLDNGAPFQISWNMNPNQTGITVSDCDVIRVDHYREAENRAVFNAIHGGSAVMSNMVFEDIRIENARFRLFGIAIKKTIWAKAKAWGSLRNITFRNISADGPFSERGYFSTENPKGTIRDITIENLTIGGKPILSLEDAKIDAPPEIAKTIRFLPAKQ